MSWPTSFSAVSVHAVADRIVVLRLVRNNGVFFPDASNQELVRAITRAADNAVSRRFVRRAGLCHTVPGLPA